MKEVKGKYPLSVISFQSNPELACIKVIIQSLSVIVDPFKQSVQSTKHVDLLYAIHTVLTKRKPSHHFVLKIKMILIYDVKVQC